MPEMYGSLKRALSRRDAVAIVIGTIIGTGVFLKTAVMAQQTGSPWLVLLAWAVAGALSLAGALSYGELGARFPEAGGEYVYLREAWGSTPAYLYGWQRFWIGSPGSIAAYAVGSATFISAVVDLSAVGGKTGFALGTIVIFSLINCLSVSSGGKIQSLLTILKFILILGIAAGIFALSPTKSLSHFSEILRTGQSGGVSAFGAAVLAALWAFDGWNNLPMAAGEVREPAKNLPFALIWGTIAVFAVYAVVNVAYMLALPLADVITSNSSTYRDALPVATKAAATFMGDSAARVLSIAFVISALGAMNGSILTGARVPYAMARDGLFFRILGRLNERTHVPAISVLVQGAWACVLAASGTFDQLTDMVVFSSWLFYAMCTAGVLKLRQSRGPSPEYRVPGGMALPVVFCICAALLLVNTLITTPRESSIGLLILLAAIPLRSLLAKAP